jgi:multidrug efflux system membrane fusion protein
VYKYISVFSSAGFLLLAGCNSTKVQANLDPSTMTVPVTVASATRQSVPVEIRVVGSVEASSTVQVKSRVAGQLMTVHFTEGQDVKNGDLLFEIDPRSYQEALRQAEASVARDRAQLRQAEANLGKDIAQRQKADADATRYDELAKEGIVSKEQREQIRTTAATSGESVKADQAAVESARASLDSDLSSVDKAKLDLSYCSIRSPISGRAGNLLVYPGNLVKDNDAALVVINQVSPIFVNFGVPEQYLEDIRKTNARSKLPVRVSLQNDPLKSISGSLSVIDNTVDATTGTIKLKAVFEDRARMLWPGQFVDTVLVLGAQDNATVIPAEAVQAGQQGQLVYVVKKDQTVEARAVTVGRSLDRKVVIEKGVQPGETVVTDGQLRLFPGAHIKAVPAVQAES